MVSAREIAEYASKAMVTVAAMLSLLILVSNPELDTPARPLAATLLALGTFGLLLVNLRSPSRR